MAWNITADITETCSCNMLCPCWYGVKELMIMDRGWCASAFFFRVKEGDADGVDLGGQALAIVTDAPGPTQLDGKLTGRLYLDRAASDQQRRALEGIFQGQWGGPMEILGALVSRCLPSATANIEIEESDDGLTATVGDFGRVVSHPMSNEAGAPMLMQNAGFTTGLQFDDHAAQLAPSGSQWYDRDMPRPFDTRSGAVSSFTWSVS